MSKMEPAHEIYDMMNKMLTKVVQAQKMPISAKAKDDIKMICSKAFDDVVEQTSPMVIERLIYNANMKRNG